MANPQLENGFTSISNELLEQLALHHLSPNQWQVLLFIIRKTYGYHKKVDYIANKQICDGTGLCKAVVSRCCAKLWDMNMIQRNGKTIGLQKDWEQWKVDQTANSEKLAISSTKLAKQSTRLAISSTKVSSCAVTQKIKDNKQKKLIQKKDIYGELQNVKLTVSEYSKLQERYGSSLKGKIEDLSLYIASKGKDKYDSHYAVIIKWANNDEKKNKKGGRNDRINPDFKDPEEYRRLSLG